MTKVSAGFSTPSKVRHPVLAPEKGTKAEILLAALGVNWTPSVFAPLSLKPMKGGTLDPEAWSCNRPSATASRVWLRT